MVPLNYTVISNEGSYNRDSVELSIKEILSAMSRCLSLGKSIHLDFIEVGQVIVKDSKVQMKFFRDFIKQLDSNGELEDLFKLQTTRSEMSIMTNPRSTTSSDQFLPRCHNTMISIITYYNVFPMCRITTEISNTHFSTAAIEREGSINSNGGTDKNIASILKDECTLEDRSNPCQLLPRAVLLVSTNEEHTCKDLSTSNPHGDQSKYT